MKLNEHAPSDDELLIGLMAAIHRVGNEPAAGLVNSRIVKFLGKNDFSESFENLAREVGVNCDDLVAAFMDEMFKRGGHFILVKKGHIN